MEPLQNKIQCPVEEVRRRISKNLLVVGFLSARERGGRRGGGLIVTRIAAPLSSIASRWKELRRRCCGKHGGVSPSAFMGRAAEERGWREPSAVSRHRLCETSFSSLTYGVRITWDPHVSDLFPSLQ
jgi:hypothetical protein